MSKETFIERYNKHIHDGTIKCPKCKAPIIFVHGGGWDYDIEYCSSRNGCDYEVEYETTTDIENEK